MRTAAEELRDHGRRAAVLSAEFVACAVAAIALWNLSERVQGALPEIQTTFLAVFLAFGAAFVRFVARVIPVVAFRCPRCDGRFHSHRGGAALGLRACANCGLSMPSLRGASD